jgi:hypothetical protein
MEASKKALANATARDLEDFKKWLSVYSFSSFHRLCAVCSPESPPTRYWPSHRTNTFFFTRKCKQMGSSGAVACLSDREASRAASSIEPEWCRCQQVTQKRVSCRFPSPRMLLKCPKRHNRSMMGNIPSRDVKVEHDNKFVVFYELTGGYWLTTLPVANDFRSNQRPPSSRRLSRFQVMKNQRTK